MTVRPDRCSTGIRRNGTGWRSRAVQTPRSAYLRQGEPGQAVAEAEDVHTLSAHIGSSRVGKRFAELMANIAEYDLPEARSLAERVGVGSN